MHKHKTADGKIVIHVHPYNLKKDADGSKHHQSDTEIHLLDVVFQGSYLQQDFNTYQQPIVTPVILPLNTHQYLLFQVNIPHRFYLRGPPLQKG